VRLEVESAALNQEETSSVSVADVACESTVPHSHNVANNMIELEIRCGVKERDRRDCGATQYVPKARWTSFAQCLFGWAPNYL
jgi:hypothetical protein